MRKFFKKSLAIILTIATALTCFCTPAYAASKLSKPEVKISVSSTSNPTLKLSWKEVEGANKYYIYRTETKGSSLKLIAKTSKLYYKDSGLSLDKTYYYKVRAYKLSNGKVKSKSDASSTVSSAVVKLSSPTVTAKAVSDSSIQISFNSVKGADRYYIYYSTSSSGTYKSIGYTTKMSYTFTKLQASTTYYFKIKSAKVVDGKAYMSSFSKVTSCKTSSKNGEHIVDFKKIPNGTDLPNGSPITCATMFLNFYGVKVDKMEMFDYFEYSNEFYYDDNGDLWGPNPYVYCVGNPKNKNSNVMTYSYIRVIQNYVKDNKITNFYQNLEFSPYEFETAKKYFDSNNICIGIFYDVNKVNRNTNKEWLYTSGKDSYLAAFRKEEKCVVFCGYTDNEEIIYYDPKENKFGKISIRVGMFDKMFGI